MARSSVIYTIQYYRNAVVTESLVSVRPGGLSCQWSSNDNNTTNDNDRYRQPTMDRAAILGVNQ
jgi:hypothetical protein